MTSGCLLKVKDKDSAFVSTFVVRGGKLPACSWIKKWAMDQFFFQQILWKLQNFPSDVHVPGTKLPILWYMHVVRFSYKFLCNLTCQERKVVLQKGCYLSCQCQKGTQAVLRKCRSHSKFTYELLSMSCKRTIRWQCLYQIKDGSFLPDLLFLLIKIKQYLAAVLPPTSWSRPNNVS